MPAHGEYRMLKLHAELAQEIGIPKENTFICANGDMLQLRNHEVKNLGIHVPADDIYIDGTDLDGLSSSVINDREQLKDNGIVIVTLTVDAKHNKIVVPAAVHTKGFNTREDAHVVRHAQMHAQEAVEQVMVRRASFAEIKGAIKEALSHYIYRRTERNPMIVPIIMNAAEK